MDEDKQDLSFESRLRKAEDTINSATKKISSSISKKVSSIDTNSIIDKTQESINNFNNRILEVTRNADLGVKMTKFGYSIEKIGDKLYSISRTIFSYFPYLLSSMVIFQTALWVGWLTDNSSTNDLISIYSDDFSHDQAMTFVILTIFGCLAGYVLTTDVSNSDILGESVLSPSSADLLVALLVVSAILYLLRMSSSLYYVFLAFIGSVLVRIMETSEINLTTLTLISIILIGYLSILSLPFINSILDGSFYRLKKSNSILNPEEYISESTFQTSDFGEISYDTSLLDDIEFTMNSDNSPISKPKRPSRRSEYEMYEWVLLLANFILWPSVLVISIVLGSEVEISGSSFSMDDNYMMLLGPLGLTAFFFTLLYRMDANARDGSLYKGEKQAYLDEMEKFIEAKRAYLDLVTLQAEVKQAQLREENPTLQKNSHTSTSE